MNWMLMNGSKEHEEMTKEQEWYRRYLKCEHWQKENKEKHNCNIPWAILMDPTSACNLKCTGCWAAEYGNHMNLTYEEMDDIVKQGVEMGTYVYLFTGGEPLVRKKDIIRLCEEHPDCVFSTFTNGTLIDEAFADEMLRVKNFMPAISIEGFEEATDSRRGEGTYQKIIRAMNILKERKLPFGISCCYTSANAEVIGSEAYFDQMDVWDGMYCRYERGFSEHTGSFREGNRRKSQAASVGAVTR